MSDCLWELRTADTGPRPTTSGSRQLPSAVGKLLADLAAGGAKGMLPPVVGDGPDGTVRVVRHLEGRAESDALATALSDDRFTPLTAALERLDTWCLRAAEQQRGRVAPGVLDVTNAELFGPVVTELFEACVTRTARRAADFTALRVAQFERCLDLFLARLAHDRPAGLPDVPGLDGPVSGIRAHGDETHNGGGRVLRLEFAGGGRLAYKPRPASGEVLFLAESAESAEGAPPASVFALLNALPPASGPVRLPVLRCRMGQDPDGAAYSWHEWIEPPASIGDLRTDDELALRATVLDPERAGTLWHRAGALAAAAFAFGIADLIGPNVPAGSRPGDDGPLLYPVDLEVYFTDVERLSGTGLVQGPLGAGHHHVGLENVPRWCDLDGPPTCWTQDADGVLRLTRRTRPLARTWAPSLVADTEGRTGYGPYLGRMLRGMFDAWTLMCRNRRRIAEFIAERAPDHVVRVLARPTREYANALGAGPGDAVVLARDERSQLARGDVPYFFRRADGGPLWALDPRHGRAVEARLPELGDGPAGPPAAVVREGHGLDLARLGIALRDAVTHVAADLGRPDVTLHDDGVRIALHGPHDGEVSFEWTGTGRRITYSWTPTTLRLRIDEMDEPTGMSPTDGEAARPCDRIRERLRRLARVDAALREPWAAGGFTDTELERRLRQLTDTAADWLDGVIAEHGWPGRRLVGEEAAAVASRLVQHLVDRTDFQRRCLRLVEQAAAEGDVPEREVAYLTDALRWAEGREQVYGTKFRDVAGDLVPCPIEDPTRVDERRAAVGLGPLNEYAQRLRERFAPTVGEPA
ncbi:DUF6624 domain-containing protein [Streptomyces hundungensis]|uniref:DUF6624 domain-containing protein n=1 Tax=Streptomyces hundungensis TaxID=1077946 RepID=UPI0033F27BF7